MGQGQPLSLSERKKLAEELRQQYRIWGDEAFSAGSPAWSKHYYRLAERYLHFIHSPHLEAMHALATSSPSEEGAFASQKPNFFVIEEEKPSRPTAKVIAMINFEGPSRKEAANQTSQEEREAFIRGLIAVTRTGPKTVASFKRHRSSLGSSLGQDDLLRDGDET
jgi:hypothetical protein